MNKKGLTEDLQETIEQPYFLLLQRSTFTYGHMHARAHTYINKCNPNNIFWRIVLIFFLKLSWRGVQRIAQSMKCLLCKHEYLSCTSRIYRRQKRLVWWHAYNLSAREVETGRSILWAHWLASLSELVSSRLIRALKNKTNKKPWKTTPRIVSDFHT